MGVIGITGGTGFVGMHVAKLLINKGYDVIIFTRSPSKYTNTNHLTYALWSPSTQQADLNALMQLTAVIHLAGEGIADKRWTKKRKQQIRESRIDGTRFLIDLLKEHSPDCRTFIGASAIGYYGPDRNTGMFTETSPPYNDFLADTCVSWEQASQPVDTLMRRVILRFGIVLGKEAGAFPEFSKPASMGIEAILGSGKQILSWIHIDDLASMIDFALDNGEIRGIYNAVAPIPVSQKVLMYSIGYNMGGLKLPVRVPAIFLKQALGEMSTEVLKSTTVSSAKIQAAGFIYKYPTVSAAVGNLVG